MTNMRKDQSEDELDAFLQGKDDLSRLLQSLPQPAPAPALDAAILARAEADLAQAGLKNAGRRLHAAANDPAMPGNSKGAPHSLKRWRTPLALAASVLCTLLLLMRWQSQLDGATPIVVAQAPQPAASAPPAMRANDIPSAPQASLPRDTSASPGIREDGKVAGKSPAAKPERQSHPGTARDGQEDASPGAAGTESPTQIARAWIPDDLPARAVMPPPAPAPAAAAAAPASPPVSHEAAATLTPPDPEKARAWIALIEELLKADLRQDALAEWEKFRQAYPRYPVPEKLDARIKALKK